MWPNTPPLFLWLTLLISSSQASHISFSLWCSGTATKARGGSAKPGPGFGAWLLSVERDPGPLRAEQRVEGRGELKEAMRGRRAAAAQAASSIVLDHLQRASIPMERLDFSVERVREKGREQREGERERERHGRREEESVKRERKVVVWVVTSLHSFLPPPFSTACIHLPFIQQAILRWSICVLEQGDIGNLAAQMHHCASLELPLGASMCVCISVPVFSVTRMSRSLPSQALHPPEASPKKKKKKSRTLYSII